MSLLSLFGFLQASSQIPTQPQRNSREEVFPEPFRGAFIHTRVARPLNSLENDRKPGLCYVSKSAWTPKLGKRSNMLYESKRLKPKLKFKLCRSTYAHDPIHIVHFVVFNGFVTVVLRTLSYRLYPHPKHLGNVPKILHHYVPLYPVSV